MSTYSNNQFLPDSTMSGMSFYERLRAFISQYEKLLEECAQTDGKYLVAEEKRRISVMESYIYSTGHCEPLSRDEIARKIVSESGDGKKIKSAVETIRISLHDFISDCRQILLDGKIVDGITVDPMLVEEIKGLRDNLGTTVTLETFKAKTGIQDQDERTLLFFSDLLGMKQSDAKQYERFVTKNSVSEINKNYDTFLSYFREHVINIRYKEDFLPHLKETFKDEKLRESFNSLVCHSNEFIWDTRDGIDYVALRWDKLRDRAPRVCWILYELGADSIKNAVLADEVRKVYSRYAKRFGINDELSAATLLNIGQREKCWKPYPLGKTQFWINRESKNFEYNIDDYARKYIQSHPNDLVGFERQAEVDGYTRLYDPRRIAEAFYGVGGVVGQRRNRNMAGGRVAYSITDKRERLDFAKQILEDEAKPMFQTDLIEEVLKNYPSLNKQTLGAWIKSRPDIFNYTAQKGRNSAIISLVGMQDGTQPRTYRQKIKDEAVIYLYGKNGYSDIKKSVYAFFGKDIPKGINCDSALSAIFGDTELFVRDEVTIKLTDYAVKIRQAKTPSISDGIKPVKVDINKLYTPEYDWESLKPILFKELHAEFRIDPSFNLEKNLETMFEIMAFGDKKISENSIFHGLLSSLPDFFKKELANDRKLALRNNCDICLEPYLKSFYKLKYGRDLVSDIVYDYHLQNNGAGLGTMCKYFEDNLGILPYQNHVPNFSLELYIKRCLNESKSKRNSEVGHPDYYVDLSDRSVMNRICEVFSVFVYIASKF